MAKYLDDNGLLYLWSKIKSVFVAKESGKGLSTNDYTTAEKSKLAGIADSANNYSLPKASASVLGGVKVGSGLSVDANGTLSATQGGTADSVEWSGVNNHPTTLSGYGVTDAYTKTEIDGKLSAVYKPQGSIAFASLPAGSSTNLGYVYNITDDFITTAAFVEGSGKKYTAGTNVVIVQNSGDYKYDVLSGYIDITAISNSEIDTVAAS